MGTRTHILEKIAWLAERESIDEAEPCCELGGPIELEDLGPSMVEIISGLELAYDIAIKDDEADRVWRTGTVGDLVDIVEWKVEG